MCMSNVRDFGDVEKPQYGYKVFCVQGLFQGLSSMMKALALYGVATYELNTGYTAKSEPEHRADIVYSPGFHVFFTKKDAEVYAAMYRALVLCVLRVEVTDHSNVGETDADASLLPTFTAKRMRVVELLDLEKICSGLSWKPGEELPTFSPLSDSPVVSYIGVDDCPPALLCLPSTS